MVEKKAIKPQVLKSYERIAKLTPEGKPILNENEGYYVSLQLGVVAYNKSSPEYIQHKVDLKAKKAQRKIKKQEKIKTIIAEKVAQARSKIKKDYEKIIDKRVKAEAKAMILEEKAADARRKAKGIVL